ncbi:MAG: hypothetical protein A3H96_12970 [Acidobacteria bacterium RIFCSPLOWO2_02_FULL_67_36]|nr:MAG: hypothetical protein A3H96_12970 [Acidobacteria bacterium RIFCSPLOWO2_02_FULL_67_36]OFW23535.1 MAG: hypothetical protein A3G21_06280 [Acidobacteria bacterium RIFCSPLOWO2_12_FULL_66_21]
MSVVLSSVRVGQPRTVAGATPWVTGFFKDRVSGPVRLSRENLAGDRQADLRVHGGPDKAVCVYSADHYPAWRRELGIEDCGPGWFGENFSVEGQTETTACIGDVYRAGSALVQISQPRGPCWKLARRWGRPEFVQLVTDSRRTGWYLRVIEEGDVTAGESLVLTERPYSQWTVARVNDLTYTRRPAASRLGGERLELAACPALADRWGAGLVRKAAEADSAQSA